MSGTLSGEVSRRRAIAAVLLASCIPLPALGQSGRPAAPPRAHAEARLLAGERDGDVLRAGLEITLEAGFKTYWRSPGESGVPPSFDWSGSRNLRSVEIGWPAPRWIEDGSGTSYGYEGQVLLPLKVHPADPAQPVALALRLDYGVCRDLCVPEHAELALSWPREPDPEPVRAIRAAALEVPLEKPVGGPGEPAIVRIDREPDGRLSVAVRTAADAPVPQLFVEAPEPWFMLARRDTMDLSGPASPPGPVLRSFTLEIPERPREAATPVDVVFTLVAGDRSVETRTRLDAALLAR